jgi:hypothetical protein
LVRLSLSSPLSGLMGVVPPAEGVIYQRNVGHDIKSTMQGFRHNISCEMKPLLCFRCDGMRVQSDNKVQSNSYFHAVELLGVGLKLSRPVWQAAHLELKRNSPDLGSSSCANPANG